MIRVDLPWPPTALRPNASSPGAWRRKSEAAKAYKADCIITCRAAGLARVNVDWLHLTLRFCPPDKRRRDLDNLLASVKHGIDAVSHVVGVDDCHFGFTILRGDPVKGGQVIITIASDARPIGEILPSIVARLGAALEEAE